MGGKAFFMGEIILDKFRKFPIPKKKYFFPLILSIFACRFQICNQNLGDGTRNVFFKFYVLARTLQLIGMLLWYVIMYVCYYVVCYYGMLLWNGMLFWMLNTPTMFIFKNYLPNPVKSCFKSAHL